MCWPKFQTPSYILYPQNRKNDRKSKCLGTLDSKLFRLSNGTIVFSVNPLSQNRQTQSHFYWDDLLYNLYDHAKSCVKKGGEISDFFKCNAGVRQGENLSPLLFALYLNDFERYLSKSYCGLTYFSGLVNRELGDEDIMLFVRLFVLLYADDTIVLAESESELQLALNAACNYCKDWHLTLNLSKTKIYNIFQRQNNKSSGFYIQ